MASRWIPFNWARPLRTNYPIMAKDGPGPAEQLRLFDQPAGKAWTSSTSRPLETACSIMPLNTVVRTMDTENLTRGYIQSWNFTLERRFGNWIATAGYVATRSVNQLAGLDQNWGDIGEGNPGRQLNKLLGAGRHDYTVRQPRHCEIRFAADQARAPVQQWRAGQSGLHLGTRTRLHR